MDVCVYLNEVAERGTFQYDGKSSNIEFRSSPMTELIRNPKWMDRRSCSETHVRSPFRIGFSANSTRTDRASLYTLTGISEQLDMQHTIFTTTARPSAFPAPSPLDQTSLHAPHRDDIKSDRNCHNVHNANEYPVPKSSGKCRTLVAEFGRSAETGLSRSLTLVSCTTNGRGRKFPACSIGQ